MAQRGLTPFASMRCCFSAHRCCFLRHSMDFGSTKLAPYVVIRGGRVDGAADGCYHEPELFAPSIDTGFGSKRLRRTKLCLCSSNSPIVSSVASIVQSCWWHRARLQMQFLRDASNDNDDMQCPGPALLDCATTGSCPSRRFLISDRIAILCGCNKSGK